MGEKGAWARSRNLLFKFWDPLNISGMAEAKTQILHTHGRSEILNQKMNNGSNGGMAWVMWPTF